MNETRVLLLFPTAGRMDHVFPAIQYCIHNEITTRANRLCIHFLPLNAIALENLPKFVSLIENQNREQASRNELNDAAPLEIEFIISARVLEVGNWASEIEQIIQSYKSESNLLECTVALGSQVPDVVALQTSKVSLSHSIISMIRVPAGYDIQTPPEHFNPGDSLSNQVFHHELLGSLSVRDPLIFVAKNNTVREVLLGIRRLHDSLKNPGGEAFKAQEILKNINIKRKDLLRKKEMKGSQLSNILKSLRSQNLISSEKSRHGLTHMGFVLSGILSED